MNIVRKLIKQVITEIFDNIKMPDEFEIITDIGKTTYNFKNDGAYYGVEFTKVNNEKIEEIMVPDKSVMEIILSTENKYNIDFGILTNGGISDNTETNQYNVASVMSNICAITNDFIAKNDAKIIIYYATKKRDLIYKYIYEKYMKNDFIYYTAKEIPLYDRFLIKKDLIK